MKLDSIITNILVKIGNKREVSSDKVYDIIKGYHKGIKHVISNVDKATVVKLDFLGKIVYDERSYNAAERLKEKVRSNKKDLTPISLDEINVDQPGNQTS